MGAYIRVAQLKRKVDVLLHGDGEEVNGFGDTIEESQINKRARLERTASVGDLSFQGSLVVLNQAFGASGSSEALGTSCGIADGTALDFFGSAPLNMRNRGVFSTPSSCLLNQGAFDSVFINLDNKLVFGSAVIPNESESTSTGTPNSEGSTENISLLGAPNPDVNKEPVKAGLTIPEQPKSVPNPEVKEPVLNTTEQPKIVPTPEVSTDIKPLGQSILCPPKLEVGTAIKPTEKPILTPPKLEVSKDIKSPENAVLSTPNQDVKLPSNQAVFGQPKSTQIADIISTLTAPKLPLKDGPSTIKDPTFLVPSPPSIALLRSSASKSSLVTESKITGGPKMEPGIGGSSSQSIVPALKDELSQSHKLRKEIAAKIITLFQQVASRVEPWNQDDIADAFWSGENEAEHTAKPTDKTK